MTSSERAEGNMTSLPEWDEEREARAYAEAILKDNPADPVGNMFRRLLKRTAWCRYAIGAWKAEETDWRKTERALVAARKRIEELEAQ